MPQTKRIFLVAYGGAHIQMLLPVIKKLQALGHECIVLALTSAQPLMRANKLAYIGFADLVEPGDEAALAKGSVLATDLPTAPLDAKETSAYLGLSYHDLEVRLGKEAATARYAEKGRQCFEPVTILKRALQKYKPDLVVVTSSPRAEKAAAMAAHELGIPSVSVIDLFGKFTTWAADPQFTDRLLVFCDMARDFFVAHGRPAEDIVVTGNPPMDRLSDAAWTEKGNAWRRARGWEKEKIIFWASHAEPAPHEDLPARIDAAVLAAVARHPDWRLITRFHPSEPVRFTKAGPQVYVSPKEEELTPLLFACDACLIINSTVGLEGAIIGKPLVSVDMSVFTPLTPFADLGISVGVKKLDDLEAALTQALARGYFRPPGLPPVGGATEAVVDNIIAMLSVR